MGKFSYKDILNNKLSLDKAAGLEEIYLDPRTVEPSENNFYSTENIEELADSFLTVGQQQPTLLGKVNGVFKIASGHRRNLANIMNLERGHEEYQEVKYLYKEMTEAEFELNLIIGNAFNRKLTPYEESEQVRKLKDALERAKLEDGLEIHGRLRDVIADLLNKKPTQVTELNKISSELSDTAKEKFKKGEIGKTTAYELSKLSHEEQNEIVEAAEENNVTKGKEIAEMIKEKQAKKLINTPCESESDTSEEQLQGQMDITNYEGVVPEENKHVEIPQNAPEKAIEQKIYKKGEPRESIKHYIKISAMFFEDVAAGLKNFELRFNDRDYRVGDTLHMSEYQDGHNTGRFIEEEIIYMLEDFVGLKENYCIIGTKLTTGIEQE